jgi:hypothetical protein
VTLLPHDRNRAKLILERKFDCETKLATEMNVNAKSIVKKRLEQFEKKKEENLKKSDPKSFQRTRWHIRSHGRFKKVVNDSRGVPPKRSIADLP